VNFKLRLKKFPHLSHGQSTGLSPGPGRGRLTWATMPLCKDGAGVRGFS